MKRKPLTAISLLAFILFLAGTVLAQDNTEVTIQVKRDGKVLRDTTYMFEEEADATNAVELFEMLNGEDPHKAGFHYTMAHAGGEHSKAMVFVSEDGEKTGIKEIHGDSLVWISEDDHDGAVKVMKYKVHKEGHEGGEHVVVVTSSEGGTFDVLIDEELEGDQLKKEKNVKVVVKEDKDGMMHITEEELVGSNEEVYVIEGDDVEKQLKEILKKVETSDDENTKVIVIRKGEGSKEKPEKNSEK